MLAVALAVVMIPTMGPAPPSSSTPTFCLVCGERGGADVIANIILFIPMGVALAIQGWRVRTQLLFAFGVTLFIESAQSTVIPGRDASLGDLLFNTVGAAVGIALTMSAIHWILPRGRSKSLLQIVGGVFPALAILLTGFLTQPHLKADRYRSQWTQQLSQTDWYRGKLDSVYLGNRPLPQGYLEARDFVSDSVAGGSTLRIRGTAGPRPEGFGPIFTIRAQRNREIWMSGQRGDDLVFRYRPKAATLRLMQPSFRIRGAMIQFQEGDALTMDFRRQRPGFDVRIGDTSYHVTFRARDGWRLVFPTFGAPPRLQELLSIFWMAGLFFPFGLWMGVTRSTLAAAGFLGTAVIIASALQLLGLPGWTELIGSIGGLFVGWATHQFASRVVAVPTKESHLANAKQPA